MQKRGPDLRKDGIIKTTVNPDQLDGFGVYNMGNQQRRD